MRLDYRILHVITWIDVIKDLTLIYLLIHFWQGWYGLLLLLIFWFTAWATDQFIILWREKIEDKLDQQDLEEELERIDQQYGTII